MSNSVRPHPCDSPGKNTGVGCYFLLQCMQVKSESEVTRSCPTLSDPQPTGLLHPWDFPGKSTGMGCHCLLCLKAQFPTNPYSFLLYPSVSFPFKNPPFFFNFIIICLLISFIRLSSLRMGFLSFFFESSFSHTALGP